MSPRAACRLNQLGYSAYDYAAGKADWLAFGLPHEGMARLVGEWVRDDVPTCEPSEMLQDVASRLEASRFGLVVVTTDDDSSGASSTRQVQSGIVLGRLDRDALYGDLSLPAAQAMREGPTTVRPSEQVGELAERMRHAGADTVVVTRSDGTLVGMLERHRVEQAARDGGA